MANRPKGGKRKGRVNILTEKTGTGGKSGVRRRKRSEGEKGIALSRGEFILSKDLSTRLSARTSKTHTHGTKCRTWLYDRGRGRKCARGRSLLRKPVRCSYPNERETRDTRSR